MLILSFFFSFGRMKIYSIHIFRGGKHSEYNDQLYVSSRQSIVISTKVDFMSLWPLRAVPRPTLIRRKQTNIFILFWTPSTSWSFPFHVHEYWIRSIFIFLFYFFIYLWFFFFASYYFWWMLILLTANFVWGGILFPVFVLLFSSCFVYFESYQFAWVNLPFRDFYLANSLHEWTRTPLSLKE